MRGGAGAGAAAGTLANFNFATGFLCLWRSCDLSAHKPTNALSHDLHLYASLRRLALGGVSGTCSGSQIVIVVPSANFLRREKPQLTQRLLSPPRELVDDEFDAHDTTESVSVTQVVDWVDWGAAASFLCLD